MAIVALGFVLLGNVGTVAKITSFWSLLVFAMVNIAFLHLRRVAPHLHRPFHVPLSIGWAPVTGLLGAASCLLLLTQFDWFSVLLGAMLPISGMVVYMFMNGGSVLATDRRLHQRHEPDARA